MIHCTLALFGLVLGGLTTLGKGKKGRRTGKGRRKEKERGKGEKVGTPTFYVKVTPYE